MKIYGIGVLKAPGTSRIIHDFEDGPFDTTNPVILAEARRLGLSFEPLPIKVIKADQAVVSTPTMQVVQVKRKYQKKAKNGS